MREETFQFLFKLIGIMVIVTSIVVVSGFVLAAHNRDITLERKERPAERRGHCTATRNTPKCYIWQSEQILEDELQLIHKDLVRIAEALERMEARDE